MASTSNQPQQQQPFTFVYGVPGGCSIAGLIALEWSGIPYQLIRHEILGKEKSEAFLKLSPLGQTPVAVTERGTVLLENAAIASHIGSRDLSKQLHAAQGTEEFDEINFLVGYLNSTVHPTWHNFFKARHSTNPDHAAVFLADATAGVTRAFKRLNDLLEGKKYLAGDHKTVADAVFLSVTRWNSMFQLLPDAEKTYPNVYRLIALLEEDPAVQFAYAIENKKDDAKTTGNYLGHTDYDKIHTK